MEEKKIVSKEEIVTLSICLLILLFFFVPYHTILQDISTIFFEVTHIKIQTSKYLDNPLFTLGDMLAGVGLLFTVYQLRSKSWETIFKIRRVLFGGLVFLMVVGIFCTFLSLFKKEISDFLQIFSAGILVAMPFLFLIISSEKHLFGFGNKKTFLRELVDRISKGGDDDYAVAVDILKANFKAISKLFSINRYAKSVISLLTDKDIANRITTVRSDFLKEIIVFLKNESQYFPLDATVKAVARTIFNIGFDNKNSYFYREIDGNERGLLKFCFGDFKFQDNLRILQNFSFPAYDAIESGKVDLLTRCLEITIEAYFNQNKEEQIFDDNYLEHIINDNLLSVLRTSFWTEKIGNDDLSINGKKIVSAVTLFHSSFTRLIRNRYNAENLSTDEIEIKIEDKEKYPYSHPQSFTALYVQFSVELLSILSFHPDKRMVYHEALLIMSSVFGLDDKFRTLFNELVWKQINNNINGYYPAILPSYLEVVGFSGSRSDQIGNTEKQEYNKLVKFLNEKLKPKLILEAKMVNNQDYMKDVLLGHSVSFEEGNFVYTDSALKRTILVEK